MNPSDATGALERFFALLERSPIIFVAAFFALYAAVLSVVFVRFVTRHNREEMERVQGQIAIMDGLHKLMDVLNPLVYELQRKGARRGGTNPGFKPAELKGNAE